MFSDDRLHRTPATTVLPGQLAALCVQLCTGGTHDRRRVTPATLRDRFEIVNGRRGVALQATVQGGCTGAIQFVACTAGGRWFRALCGPFPTEAAAWAALDQIIARLAMEAAQVLEATAHAERMQRVEASIIARPAAWDVARDNGTLTLIAPDGAEWTLVQGIWGVAFQHIDGRSHSRPWELDAPPAPPAEVPWWRQENALERASAPVASAPVATAAPATPTLADLRARFSRA